MRHAKLGAKTYLSREPRLHSQYFEHKHTHKLVPNLAAAFHKVQVSYSSLTACALVDQSRVKHLAPFIGSYRTRVP